MNDIGIGDGVWLPCGEYLDLRDPFNVEPILLPILDVLETLEMECVAECCGIDAFNFWPERIRSSMVKLDAERLPALSRDFEEAVKKLMELSAETVVSNRLNQLFPRSVLIELLKHIHQSLLSCPPGTPPST